MSTSIRDTRFTRLIFTTIPALLPSSRKRNPLQPG